MLNWSTGLNLFRKLLPCNVFSHCCQTRSHLPAVAHPTFPVSYCKQADLGGYQYPTIIKAQLFKQTYWLESRGSFSLWLPSVLLVSDSVLLPQLCSSEFWHYSVARDCLFILLSHLLLIKYLSMLKETLQWGKKNNPVFPVTLTNAIEGIIYINSKRSW